MKEKNPKNKQTKGKKKTSKKKKKYMTSLLNWILRAEISQRDGNVSYTMLSELIIFLIITFIYKSAFNKFQEKKKTFLKGFQEEQIHV